MDVPLLWPWTACDAGSPPSNNTYDGHRGRSEEAIYGNTKTLIFGYLMDTVIVTWSSMWKTIIPIWHLQYCGTGCQQCSTKLKVPTCPSGFDYHLPEPYLHLPETNKYKKRLTSQKNKVKWLVHPKSMNTSSECIWMATIIVTIDRVTALYWLHYRKIGKVKKL